MLHLRFCIFVLKEQFNKSIVLHQILLLTTLDVLCYRKVTLIINKEELEKLGDAPKVRVNIFLCSLLYCWNLEVNNYLAGDSSIHGKFGGWLFS